MSTVLEAELLVHLDQQINSARHLLKLVLAQGTAIRERDTEAVLARLADIQIGDGAARRARAGAHQPAAACRRRPRHAGHDRHARASLQPITPDAATAAMQRSAELRGLLAEIAREHGINRALMRQELAFLSHLTRLIGQEPEPGYSPPNGARPHPPRAVRLPRSGPPGLTPLDFRCPSPLSTACRPP